MITWASTRLVSDGVVPAQVPGPGRAALRPLPGLRQLLCVGGARRAAPGPRQHLLALSRTPRRRESTSRRDALDASVAQVCAKPFDATLHEDQLTLDFKNLSVLTQRFH